MHKGWKGKGIMNGEKQNPLAIIGGVIIGIIVFIVSYFCWVNSGSFDGPIFGMAFQLPFETIDHYCYRKTNHIFTHNASEKEQCIKEENARQANRSLNSSDIHTRLKGHILKTFTDEKGRTITDAQAKYIAKSIERYYNNTQIERVIVGGKISDNEISASDQLKLASEMTACVGL